MLGMLGIIVQNNEIKNTTQILQVVTPGERYLVRFLNPPAFSRVCGVEEIQGWLLFTTQEEANAWVKASTNQPQQGDLPLGKPPVPSDPPAAKPNGNGNDLQDKGTDNPPPELPPAAPVGDHSRFMRPKKEDNDKS